MTFRARGGAVVERSPTKLEVQGSNPSWGGLKLKTFGFGFVSQQRINLTGPFGKYTGVGQKLTERSCTRHFPISLKYLVIMHQMLRALVSMFVIVHGMCNAISPEGATWPAS